MAAKQERKKTPGGAPTTGGSRAPGWLPFALFLLALVLRLLFWQATADRTWPHTVYYHGDALTWLDYASALQADQPFEQGLPLRPPGNAYLIAALWDGSPGGIAFLKIVWCTFGALAVAVLYQAALRAFGFQVALPAGLLCAVASPLLILSTSLNNETPYLLVAACLLALAKGLAERPSAGRLVAWGALNAAACLLRAEHLLFVVLATAAVVAAWRRHDRVGMRPRVALRRLAILGAAFALALAPWQWQAWRAARDFNRVEAPLPAATALAMESLERDLAFLHWDADALARRAELPAFCRRALSNFVALTVAQRGGKAIRGEDFAILEQAFGSWPEPISEYPLLVLYGGLNFYLANNPTSDGYFGRLALELPPLLEGGAQRYPAMLIGGLPPPDLALTYPPHLEAVNHGYALGWRWIARHPGQFAGLAVKRLVQFWRGAAAGVGGFNLPGGLSGVRQRVDLVVSDHGVATLWALLWAAGFVVGLAWAMRQPAAWPWLAFFATHLVANLFFFGYARLGALAAPVVFTLTLAGLAPLLAKLWPAPAQALRAAAAIGGILLLLEAGRTFITPPKPQLDGRGIENGDPWPPDVHDPRRLELR